LLINFVFFFGFVFSLFVNHNKTKRHPLDHYIQILRGKFNNWVK